MDKQKTKTNWTLMLCCILAGIIVGMVIMYFLFTFSFERILNSSQGLFVNSSFNLNETKLVDYAYKLVQR